MSEPFVIASYVATYGVIAGYLAWLWVRRRSGSESK